LNIATGLAGRLSPGPLLRDAARVLPLAVPVIVLASILEIGGRSGYQGPAAEEWEKEYWSRNVATWEGFRMPSVSHVHLDLDIEPAERSVAVDGAYTFRNHRDRAYDRFPLTAGPWEPIDWTLGGEPYEPENRAGLYVFTLGEPLEPGDTVTIGFRHRVEVLGGISRTPQPVGKFVLESGDEVRVVPVTASVRQLKGMVPKPPEPVSLEQMDDAIAKAYANLRFRGPVARPR